MTTTATPSGSPPRSPPRRSRSTPVADPVGGFALRAVALLLVGYLLGGLLGAAAVAVGVVSTYRRSAGAVAAGAAAMLVVAALATVIETPINANALRSRFATDRPVAAAAGLIAALFALTSVVTQAARERSAPVRHPTPARNPASDTPVASRVGDVVRARAAVALGLGVAALAGVVLLLVAPGPPEATQAVARSVRGGVGWGLLVEGTVQVDGTQPPVPVIVSAVAPGGPRVWTALAGAAAVAVVAAFVSRHRGRALTLAAAGATAVGLVAARADLAGTWGAALIAGALLLGDPDGRTAARAAAAGALVGGACLCLPVLVVLLPVVVVAVAFSPGRPVRVAHAAAAAASLVVTFAPWQRWVRDRFSTWAPAARIEVPASTALAVAVPLLAAGAALRARPVKASSGRRRA